VLWSPKTSLKYTLVKGAIPHREPHREPSLLSTIALLLLDYIAVGFVAQR